MARYLDHVIFVRFIQYGNYHKHADEQFRGAADEIFFMNIY
tara:strand:- start:1406 stop:1528 length:123 start_codon:yes stop_codon:yes gene_type:complete